MVRSDGANNFTASFIDCKNATKLIVTLNIRNVTLADDSQLGKLGRYECHAFAVNDSVARIHGFSVTVGTFKFILNYLC